MRRFLFPAIIATLTVASLALTDAANASAAVLTVTPNPAAVNSTVTINGSGFNGHVGVWLVVTHPDGSQEANWALQTGDSVQHGGGTLQPLG
jgi:hypothetical protein